VDMFENATLFEVEKKPAVSLADKFVVPPFSVLDRRQGEWQNRKRRWLQMGMRSEVGRNENLAYTGQVSLNAITENEEQVGTSVFDPVICEVAYRWFSPEGGSILDPFAGGSVRGIVASQLNRSYTGYDIRPEQVQSNYDQIDLANSEFPPTWITSDIRNSAVVAEGPNHIALSHDDRPIMSVNSNNPFILEAVDLYNSTSSIPMRNDWHNVPVSMVPYLQYAYQLSSFNMSTEPNRVFSTAVDNGTMWVAFSGGKDGMAAAIKARNEGFKVILYHITGINRAWPDELKWAQEAADQMNMPLFVDKVSISGAKNGFVEMPTKNQVITEMMIGRMMEYGGSHYTLGVFSNDITSANWTLDWSDNPESVELFHQHLESRFPGLQFHQYLKNSTESIHVVASEGLINFAHGCMSQMRFRDKTKKANETKFGEILPGRCGSCKKCVKEYLNLFALEVIQFNKDFYEHCLSKAKELLKEEFTNGAGIDSIVDESFKGNIYPEEPFNAPLNVEMPEKILGGQPEGYDFIFTCPPYADLEVYSDDPQDLSNMPYDQFLKEYKEIFEAAVKQLKNDRFIGIVISDARIQKGDGHYYGLVADTVNVMREIGCELYNDLIIVDPVGTLAIRSEKQMRSSRKVGRGHQHMLIFVKGNGRNAAKECGEI